MALIVSAFARLPNYGFGEFPALAAFAKALGLEVLALKPREASVARKHCELPLRPNTQICALLRLQACASPLLWRAQLAAEASLDQLERASRASREGASSIDCESRKSLCVY